MYSHVVYAFGYRGFPPIFAFMRPLIDQAKMLHFSGFEWHKFFLVLHNFHEKEIHKYCICVVCEKRLQLNINTRYAEIICPFVSVL